MHNTLEAVCIALDDLAQKVLSSSTETRTLLEVYGWQYPPLSRDDLANLATSIAHQIRDSNADEIDEQLENELAFVPEKLQLLYSHTIPYMFNGNGVNAYPAYISALNWLRILVQPIIGWQSVTDVKLMPTRLASRLRGIQSSIDAIEPDMTKLNGQINTIQSATAAAESLPTDMASLQEARNKIDVLSMQASELKVKIELSSMDAFKNTEFIKDRKGEADKLVEQCEIAYRITTSKGLAGAFDQRATRLNWSIYGWVVGLLAALCGSIWIGSMRYAVLVNRLDAAQPSWGIISIHITLSVLALAAPVWFAWVATKQIGQRFKLAEDYAYKASVAKAYEGYRREAADIDELFVSRLFASALTRLEEAPLRLVDDEEHHSPFQELLASKGFQKALESVPEMRETFLKLFQQSVGTLTTGIGNTIAKAKGTRREETSEATE